MNLPSSWRERVPRRLTRRFRSRFSPSDKLTMLFQIPSRSFARVWSRKCGGRGMQRWLLPTLSCLASWAVVAGALVEPKAIPSFHFQALTRLVVNLRSSDILDHPNIQICNEGRQNALSEILEVLTEIW